MEWLVSTAFRRFLQLIRIDCYYNNATVASPNNPISMFGYVKCYMWTSYEIKHNAHTDKRITALALDFDFAYRYNNNKIQNPECRTSNNNNKKNEEEEKFDIITTLIT